MITLIHGDDMEAIETSLISLTGNAKLERLDGKKLKSKELEESILSESLFGENTIVVIENLFKNLNKKDLLNLINKNANQADVIIVEREKLNKRDLQSLKADSLIENLLPQYYFKFLDGIYPGEGRVLENYYRNLLKNMTAEQVFYSMVKRIRGLISVKSGALNHSEIKFFAPWQMGKLKRQASFWTEEELIEFYGKLFEIEKKMKSSNLPLTLEKYIDMVILTELN